MPLTIKHIRLQSAPRLEIFVESEEGRYIAVSVNFPYLAENIADALSKTAELIRAETKRGK